MVDIMIVDDSVEDANLAIRALKKSNLTDNLLHVEDGEDALARLDDILQNGDSLPKLILLDLKMPRVDGIETLKRIKSNQRLLGIPIVIMTSSKEERDIVNTYKLGVNAYIVKPVDLEKFIKVIADIGYFWLVLNEVPKNMIE